MIVHFRSILVCFGPFHVERNLAAAHRSEMQYEILGAFLPRMQHCFLFRSLKPDFDQYIDGNRQVVQLTRLW